MYVSNSVVAYLQSTWYETGGKRNEWCASLLCAMSIKGNVAYVS